MGTGAAFIFIRTSDGWVQEAEIKAPDAESGDFFGASVGISGDRAIVGAPGEDSGNPADPTSDPLTACCTVSSGAAYIYKKSSNGWEVVTKLKGSTIEIRAGYGNAVGISGKHAIVGAAGENSFFQLDDAEFYPPAQNGVLDAGAAYIYHEVGDSWPLQSYLRGNQSFPEAHFGEAVSIEGNLAVIGAPGETVNTTDINGTISASVFTGSVYIFVRSGDTWTNQHTLNASNAQGGDFFGSSVSIQGDLIAVGAPGEDSSAKWSDDPRDGINNLLRNSGSAYLFQRTSSQWTERIYLKASNSGRDDGFGNAVAVGLRHILVGAEYEDGKLSATITDDDNSSFDAGAVYAWPTLPIPGGDLKVFGNGVPLVNQAESASATNGTDFGKLQPGSIVQNAFVLINDWVETIQIDAIQSSGDEFIVLNEGMEWPLRMDPGTSIEFQVQFKPSAAGVVKSENIRIVYGDGPFEFPVQGYATPEELEFPGSSGLLSNQDDEPLGLFGKSLAATDDMIYVGGFRHDLPVLGTESALVDAGSVRVYKMMDGIWTVHDKVSAPAPDTRDYFGWTVSAENKRLLVGAPGEDGNSRTIDENMEDNSSLESGAAYLYEEVEGQIKLISYLKPTNGESGDSFGAGVGLSGNTLIIGAPDEDSASRMINNLPDDNTLENSGAAYIFDLVDGQWVQTAYLKAANSDEFDAFGWSVAISGDIAVVGAPYESSSSNVVNGEPLNNIFFAAGAAYVFRRVDGTWTQEAYLKPSNPGSQDLFGYSVAIDGESVVVGSPEDDSSNTETTPTAADNLLPDSGVLYVFEKLGDKWQQTALLKPSAAHEKYGFGNQVSIKNNRITSGAWLDRSASPGINFKQKNSNAPESGAAYLFEKSGSGWVEKYYIKSSNPAPFDRFGFSSILSGDRLVVASPNKLINKNGNLMRNSQISVFDLNVISNFTAEKLLKLTIKPGSLEVFGDYITNYVIEETGDFKEWTPWGQVVGNGFNLPVSVPFNVDSHRFFRIQP